MLGTMLSPPPEPPANNISSSPPIVIGPKRKRSSSDDHYSKKLVLDHPPEPDFLPILPNPTEEKIQFSAEPDIPEPEPESSEIKIITINSEPNEVKIELDQDESSDDVCVIDASETSDGQVEVISHPEIGDDSQQNVVLSNMQKVFNEMRAKHEFGFLLNFSTLDEFLQNRENNEHVDVFLAW